MHTTCMVDVAAPGSASQQAGGKQRQRQHPCRMHQERQRAQRCRAASVTRGVACCHARIGAVVQVKLAAVGECVVVGVKVNEDGVVGASQRRR